MAMNNKRKSNKSLCAKSVKMVVNVVKLSSFSISKRSLETFGTPPATKSGSVKDSTNPPLPQMLGSQRAQGPMIISKPVSYLIKPDKGNNRSSYAVNEENNIDNKASEYIRKVREKNRQDLI